MSRIHSQYQVICPVCVEKHKCTPLLPEVLASHHLCMAELSPLEEGATYASQGWVSACRTPVDVVNSANPTNTVSILRDPRTKALKHLFLCAFKELDKPYITSPALAPSPKTQACHVPTSAPWQRICRLTLWRSWILYIPWINTTMFGHSLVD